MTGGPSLSPVTLPNQSNSAQLATAASGSNSSYGAADAVADPLQEPAGVDPKDTGSSVLEQLKGFQDAMGTGHLGFLYNRWAPHACCDPTVASLARSQPVYGQGTEESSMLQAMDPLGFGSFDSAAKRLGALGQAGDALNSNLTTIHTSLSSAWSDSTGQGAAGKFADLQTDTQKYTESVKTLASVMHQLWTNTRQLVANVANYPQSNPMIKSFLAAYGFTLSGDSDTDVGSAGSDWDQIINPVIKGSILGVSSGILPGAGSVIAGQAMQGWTPVGTGTGSFDVGEQSRHIDMVDSALNGGTVTYGNPTFGSGPTVNLPSDQSTRAAMLREMPGLNLGSADWHTQFSNEVCNTMDQFTSGYAQAMKAFRDCIRATFNELQSQFENLDQIVSKGASPVDITPFKDMAPPVPPPPTTTLPPGATPTGTSPSGYGGYSGSVPGGGGGGGGGGSTAPASFTPPPLSPSLTGAGSSTGSLAGAGAAASPPSMPALSSLTGATDPDSTTTSAATDPVTTTITNGANTIGITSPDSQGNVQLSLKDASGATKTYALDFGGAPGSTGSSSSSKSGSAATGARQITRQITPDANGEAVIHDGNTTITATEPDGPGGPVQLKVDDGTGKPQTYTVANTEGATAGAHGTGTNGGFTPAPLSPSTTDPSATSFSGSLSGGGAGGLSTAGLGGGGGGGAAISGLSGAPATDHASGLGAPTGAGAVSGAAPDATSASQGQAAGAAAAAPHSASGQSQPMMGGMGGMRGGQGGADTEHKGSKWRTSGKLFDDDKAGAERFLVNGVLGGEQPKQP